MPVTQTKLTGQGLLKYQQSGGIKSTELEALKQQVANAQKQGLNINDEKIKNDIFTKVKTQAGFQTGLENMGVPKESMGNYGMGSPVDILQKQNEAQLNIPQQNTDIANLSSELEQKFNPTKIQKEMESSTLGKSQTDLWNTIRALEQKKYALRPQLLQQYSDILDPNVKEALIRKAEMGIQDEINTVAGFAEQRKIMTQETARDQVAELTAERQSREQQLQNKREDLKLALARAEQSTTNQMDYYKQIAEQASALAKATAEQKQWEAERYDTTIQNTIKEFGFLPEEMAKQIEANYPEGYSPMPYPKGIKTMEYQKNQYDLAKPYYKSSGGAGGANDTNLIAQYATLIPEDIMSQIDTLPDAKTKNAALVNYIKTTLVPNQIAGEYRQNLPQIVGKGLSSEDRATLNNMGITDEEIAQAENSLKPQPPNIIDKISKSQASKDFSPILSRLNPVTGASNMIDQYTGLNTPAVQEGIRKLGQYLGISE
jgi:hypothetical protein